MERICNSSYGSQWIDKLRRRIETVSNKQQIFTKPNNYLKMHILKVEKINFTIAPNFLFA